MDRQDESPRRAVTLGGGRCYQESLEAACVGCGSWAIARCDAGRPSIDFESPSRLHGYFTLPNHSILKAPQQELAPPSV
jgi:hypothetical protein